MVMGLLKEGREGRGGVAEERKLACLAEFEWESRTAG